MKRHSLGRRLVFLSLVACGPLSLGCEAILDFDRTPLQPVVEASVPDGSPTDSSKKDGAKTTGDDDDSTDAKSDAPIPIKDAGHDGDADS